MSFNEKLTMLNNYVEDKSCESFIIDEIIVNGIVINDPMPFGFS